MSTVAYIDRQLCLDATPLARVAREYGTPLYVYSATTIRANYRRLAAAFAPLRARLCYAVKANGNLALLKLLIDEGAGLDIVSGGELYRALAAGADPAHIVFAGVGKTEAELRAALDARIGWFNVESLDEVMRLNALAEACGQNATIALRINPDVELETHRHIRTGGARSKFGFPVPEALALVRRLGEFPRLRLRGIHVHIGSQIAQPGPILRALDIALDVIARAPGVDTLDLGGGFPVQYRETDAYPSVEDFAAPIVARLLPHSDRLAFHLEPGRCLVAEAGVLVTEVQAVKVMGGRRVVVVDTGMHHLLRPALYDAYHRVWPVAQAPEEEVCDVVGPICESADVLARARRLPALKPGDLLAVLDVGAYGFSMASHYNARPRPAEVLIAERGTPGGLIRRRETYADLVALEVGLT